MAAFLMIAPTRFRSFLDPVAKTKFHLSEMLSSFTCRQLLVLGLAFCTSGLTARAATVLADGKQARFKVIVSAAAGTEVAAKAQLLADHLGRISGAEFEVAGGSGAKGIAVGVYSEFPALAASVAHLFDPDDPFRQDEYLLRSHDDGLYVLGATPLAESRGLGLPASPGLSTVLSGENLGDHSSAPAIGARGGWFRRTGLCFSSL